MEIKFEGLNAYITGRINGAEQTITMSFAEYGNLYHAMRIADTKSRIQEYLDGLQECDETDQLFEIPVTDILNNNDLLLEIAEELEEYQSNHDGDDLLYSAIFNTVQNKYGKKETTQTDGEQSPVMRSRKARSVSRKQKEV